MDMAKVAECFPAGCEPKQSRPFCFGDYNMLNYLDELSKTQATAGRAIDRRAANGGRL